jgi:hypothetical protein
LGSNKGEGVALNSSCKERGTELKAVFYKSKSEDVGIFAYYNSNY